MRRICLRLTYLSIIVPTKNEFVAKINTVFNETKLRIGGGSYRIRVVYVGG